MKTIGIIGGLAWPSTADYYRLLCSKANAHFRDRGHPSPFPTPPIVLESLNIVDARAARGQPGDEASWARYDAIFRDAFRRLQAAGADIGLIASNTPHMRLDAIRAGLDLPIVSILETTAATAAAMGGTRALVLGTPLTMRGDHYPEILRAHGITALPPPADADIEALDRMIDVDLYQGRTAAARERMLSLCETHVRNPATDIICLACTELPLAFPDYRDSARFDTDGFRFVNTSVAHVEAVLRDALAPD